MAQWQLKLPAGVKPPDLKPKRRTSTLAKTYREEFPGKFDDVDDMELESAIKDEFPGKFDDVIKDDDESYTVPSWSSRAHDIVKGGGKMIGDALVSGGNPETFVKRQQQDILNRVIEDPEYAKDISSPKGVLKYGVEQLGIPISNLQEDWEKGAYGAGAVDLAMGALGVYGLHGLYKGIRNKAALPNKPPVSVVPDVETPGGVSYEDSIPKGYKHPQLTETAGASPRTPTGELEALKRKQWPRKLLPAHVPESTDFSGERFISHPSGGVGNAFDINTPETLRALDQNSPALPPVEPVTPPISQSGPFGAGRPVPPVTPIEPVASHAVPQSTLGNMIDMWKQRIAARVKNGRELVPQKVSQMMQQTGLTEGEIAALHEEARNSLKHETLPDVNPATGTLPPIESLPENWKEVDPNRVEPHTGSVSEKWNLVSDAAKRALELAKQKVNAKFEGAGLPDDPSYMGADFGVTAAAEKLKKFLASLSEEERASLSSTTAAGAGGEIRRPGFTEPVKTPGAVELPSSMKEPWDFDKPGVRQPPEPYSQPRSQGITKDKGNPYSLQAEGDRTVPVRLTKAGKVRVKDGQFYQTGGKEVFISEDLAEMIRRGKVSPKLVQGDYIADQTLASVPDRLRPEVPNVTNLRGAAEGYPKQTDLPPVDPVEGLSGPRQNWGGPAKTVVLGEGLPRKLKGQRLAYPAQPDLPSAPVRSHISERLGSEEFITQQGKVLPKVEFPPAVEPPPQPKPSPGSGQKDVIGRGQGKGYKTYKQILKDIEDSKERVGAEDAEPTPTRIKLGRKKILNTPTADEVKLMEGQGWKVLKRNAAGDVTMQYKGVEPAEVTGEGGWRDNQKFMDKNPVFKGIMDKLISTRNAGGLIAKEVRKNFDHIKGITKEQIVKFQQDMADGHYPEVEKFYDDMFNEIKKHGLSLERKENYLTQMWDNTPEEIAKAYGGRREINANASFQFKSVYKDYAQGKAAGLTPKMAPIDLMAWYAERANKLIADATALKELRAKGYVSSIGEAAPNHVAVGGASGSFRGAFAHPEIKNAIETYLDKTPNRFLDPLRKVVGKAKGLALSSGLVPNKPLFTAHGMSMANPFQGRAFMEGGWTRQKQALRYGWYPEQAAELLSKENPQIIEAVKKHRYNPYVENPEGQGPKFFENEEGRFGTGALKKGVNKLTELQHKYWEGPMFEKMLPALKWEAWKSNFAEFKKAGMSESEAGAKATQIVDHHYGGANMDLLYKNKTWQSVSSILLLAPDWLRTTFKLGAEMPKSVAKELMGGGDKVSRVYIKSGARILGTYMAANMIQKMMTGKFMVENEPSEMFNLYFDEEHNKGIKLFGTAADMVKLPVQAVAAATQGGEKFGKGAGEMISEFGANRLSPLGRFGLAAATGEDYRGEKNLASTNDRYGNYIPAGTRLSNTLGQAVNLGPPQSAGPFNVATGRSSIPEAVIKVSEMPFIYRKKKNPFEFVPK